MKFVRFGHRGLEKPGAIDAAGTLRDLSSVMEDISAAANFWMVRLPPPKTAHKSNSH